MLQFLFFEPLPRIEYLMGDLESGIQVKVNLDSLIGDQNISIIDGGLNIFSQKKDSLLKKMTISFLESLKLPKSITMKGLSSAQKEQLFFGSNKKINFTFKFH